VSSRHRVIVVGSGLAGLSCAMKLAEEGVDVDLVSTGPARSSHSVCAQGGINACNEIARQQGYSEWTHFDETILGGDFLADQPPVHEMCYWAPRIVDLLDRMGVPFNRTAEGRRALRRMGGSLFLQTYFAGATTGQQLVYALDEQVRRHESEGRVSRHEYCEFLWPVIHEEDGHPACGGIVAQDMRTMVIRQMKADAVVIATGGYGVIFGKSTMSASCTGAAISRCYQAGAKIGNPEFIQIHPTTIPGEDKSRLISEAVRGEGARLWVPAIKEDGEWKPHPNAARGPNSIADDERYYFLEDRYPKFGNLVPRDLAAREIAEICREGFGVAGGNAVYLDLREAAKEFGRDGVTARLDGTLQIYAKFAAADPLEEPMRVSPAVHAGMGGLWVDFKKDEKTGGLRVGEPSNMSTNIAGLYAMGEASVAYHGANRLGGNGLLSRLFDGLFGGACVKNYCEESRSEAPQAAFDSVIKQETDRIARLLSNDGEESAHQIRAELSQAMTDHCTVIRHNDKLQSTLAKCQEWKDCSRRMKLTDNGNRMNQNLFFTRSVRDMVLLAETILCGALPRNESRGAHFKPAYPDRDDVNFLKATIARYDAASDSAQISYEQVDTSLIAPRVRNYGRKSEKVAASPQPAARA
jgi:succinate dehydrogenase / fumarate reductase, flavoprotein subunit